MGTEFKAASGRIVKAGREDGSLVFGKLDGYLSRESVFDAEEYFRAKEDERLERWRDPMNPDLVVYENAVGVAFVFDEFAGDYQSYTRAEAYEIDGLTYRRTARAYFEAHPESKPWHDAKPGEVWLLTVDGHEAHFVADGNDFNGTNEFWRFICCAHDDEDITAGRRIYPEDPS